MFGLGLIGLSMMVVAMPWTAFTCGSEELPRQHLKKQLALETSCQ
jgi:hypothetical protein